jgi:hypothetical protein
MKLSEDCKISNEENILTGFSVLLFHANLFNDLIFQLLRPPIRNSYLPRLPQFLLTDNDWNWRFREELANQLLAAVNLFTAEDTKKHLIPIALSLLLDKVAAVRQVALCLVSLVYFMLKLIILKKIKAINTLLRDEISGSHSGGYEDDCLLGCCTM